MKSTIRRLVFGGFATLGIAAGLVGCSSDGEPGGSQEEVGELGLPLASYGPSGTRYRLRDAQFEIHDYGYWDDYGEAGGAGTGSGGEPIIVSSEDDPDADSIVVPLERGEYYVRLLPGWHMEQVTPDGTEDVEATLLSSSATWVYVAPRSTSWTEFHFGIGDRSIWLNGKLNIGIRVSEDPDDLCDDYGWGGYAGEGGCTGGTTGAGGYGGGGTGGTTGAGGFSVGGSAGTAGWGAGGAP